MSAKRKDLNMGTAKTLMQAIQNGIDDVDKTGKSVEDSIKAHVVDFIRNKMSPTKLIGNKIEVKGALLRKRVK